MTGTQIAYISIAATLFGAVLGFVAAIISGRIGGKWSYKGAIDAVTKQLQAEQDKLIREKEENNAFALRIISKFLWNEIQYNFERLDSSELFFSKSCIIQDIPIQYTYDPLKIQFTEYNKVKYELLKYTSTTVQEIIDIYNKFYILSLHSNLKEMTMDEFYQVRNLSVVKEDIKNQLLCY